MRTVCFFIPGEVVGKGRPKFSRQGSFVRAYTPAKTTNYENLVKLEYQNAYGDFRFSDETSLAAEIVAVYSIPKSASKKKAELMRAGIMRPTKKPDLDNIAKSIFDALNQIAYKDDSQIVEVSISKRYESQDWKVGAYVTITGRG